MVFAVGVLGLVTCPAFLLTQGDAIFLAASTSSCGSFCGTP